MSAQQRILDIEAEIARTQKNKATEGHIGLLKAKLAKLKREIIDVSLKSSGGGGDGFEVAKNGDARVGLVGFPSVGKSTLLTRLTGTFSKVAAWEFTTLTCIPGVIQYKGARIQLLDLPGIVEGARENKGKGRQIIAVARTCNLILIVLDATRPAMHKKIIEGELEGFGIRLNKKAPAITIRKKDKLGGGLDIIQNVKQTKMSEETILSILREYKVINADIMFNCDADPDDLIDVLEGNRRYIPCM
jgi:small GTP-binding protein